MKKLNDLYSQITPKTSPEELSARIMNTPELKKASKRKGFRPALALSAAAIAVSSLVVTAGAVNGWDYGAVFESIFGEKAYNLQGNIVSPATITKNKSENLDISLSAIAADKHSVMAVLDIKGKNGYELFNADDENNFFNNFRVFMSVNPKDDDGIYSSSNSVHEIERGENSLRLCIRMDTHGDIKGKRFDIALSDDNRSKSEWEANFKADYTATDTVYDIDTEITIPVSFGNTEFYQSDKNAIVVDGDPERGEIVIENIEETEIPDNFIYGVDIPVEYATANIDEIGISPISVFISGDFTDSFMGEVGNLDNICVIDKNGKRIGINCSSTSGLEVLNPETNTYESISSFALIEPVKPEDIAALVIGDTIIELK